MVNFVLYLPATPSRLTWGEGGGGEGGFILFLLPEEIQFSSDQKSHISPVVIVFVCKKPCITVTSSHTSLVRFQSSTSFNVFHHVHQGSIS